LRGVKRPKPEVVHSLPINTELKMSAAIFLLHYYAIMSWAGTNSPVYVFTITVTIIFSLTDVRILI